MKIKMKKILKCSMAVLMLFTLFQSKQIDTLAVTGTMKLNYNGNWKYSTNDPNYNTHGGYSQILVNGENVFCVDPRIDAVNGASVTQGTPAQAGISEDKAKRLSLIQYFGMRLGTPDDYAITSSMIWNELGSPDWISSPSAPTWASLQNYFTQINNKITRYYIKPSFNLSNFTLNVGESITLTDTNGVLSDYTVTSKGGLDVVQNGNSITITANATSDDNAAISFKNKVSAVLSNTNVVYQSPGVQTVGSFSYSDPLFAEFRVKVNKFGSLKIGKKNTEGTNVPGTKFRLSYKADMSEPIGEYTTGADGTVQIDDLMGTKTVYYQEIAVPANLVIDKTIRSIVIVPNDVVDTTVTNKIQVGNITLKKEDTETANKPQGDATLQGAVYGLFAKNDIVDPISKKVYFAKGAKISERTTKNDGSMDAINGLYLGDYYVQELTAPNGYILNPTKYEISLTYGGEIQEVVVKNQVVKNNVITGDFQITKVIEVDPSDSEINDAEPGAEFIVVLKKYVEQYGSIEEAYKHKAEFANREYDVLVTDKDGIAKSKKLAYGTYVVKQTKVGDKNVSLLKKPFEVKIQTENQDTIKYVISNQKFLSYLQIVKKDADTGKLITLSNTSFKVYDVDNDKYLSQRVGLIRHDTWKTNDNGMVTLPLEVPAGNYRLEEIEAPNGYLIADHIEFELTEANVSIVDGEGKPITVIEVLDKKPVAEVKLIKKDVDNGETLSGVQYQLTAKEDIIDPADGSIIYKKGSSVSMDISENGYYVTNELGEIEVGNLPMGSYIFKETKALDGYVLDTKEYSFTLKQENTQQTVYTKTLSLTNKKTAVQIKKLDTAGLEVVGAKMQLLDSQGNIVSFWESGNKPYELQGLKVGELYTLRELEAPEGFVLAHDVEFEVKDTSNLQTFVMTDAQVSAIKLDEDDKVLQGAHLQVVSNKTKEIVDEWVSSNKKHLISNLVEGESYILRELEAPEGLNLADDIEFTVNDKKASQSLEMIDTYVLTKIQVNKVDSITKKAIKSKDFEFTAYKDKGCKEVLKTVSADTEKGTAIFELRYGTWYIKETKAPQGYKLSDEAKKVVINKEGIFVNDKKVKEEDTIYSFVYENELLPIIKTGDNTDNSYFVLMGLSSLVVLCVIGYNLNAKKIKD